MQWRICFLLPERPHSHATMWQAELLSVEKVRGLEEDSI